MSLEEIIFFSEGYTSIWSTITLYSLGSPFLFYWDTFSRIASTLLRLLEINESIRGPLGSWSPKWEPWDLLGTRWKKSVAWEALHLLAELKPWIVDGWPSL